MGWTSCYNATNWKTAGGRRVVDRKAECDRMLNWDSKDKDGNVIATHRLLKSAMVGSTYYAAVRTSRTGESDKVWAAVFLTSGRSKWDGSIWGYKDMDESCGPCESKCPVSILDLLTPTDCQWANEWRQRCRDYAATAKERRKLGDKAVFTPTGVSVCTKGRSWLVTSPRFRASTGYSWIRYSKVRFSPDEAMQQFLAEYGTAEQRAEFAASGRECPAEWKGKGAA